MKLLLVSNFVAFLCLTAISAKTVADLDEALCHAGAIHAGIKNDCMSNAFEKLAYVRRDLDNVKYALKDLQVNDELPEWASKVVDESSEALVRLMNSIRVGSNGEENYAKAGKYIEENCE